MLLLALLAVASFAFAQPNLADVHLQLATRGHAALVEARAGAPVVPPLLSAHIPKCTTTCATSADAYAIDALSRCTPSDTSCACRNYELLTSKCLECLTTSAGQPQKGRRPTLQL